MINDVSPDRIPVSGSGSAPPHRLGTGGTPLDKLQNLLGDADATGSSNENSTTTTPEGSRTADTHISRNFGLAGVLGLPICPPGSGTARRSAA